MAWHTARMELVLALSPPFLPSLLPPFHPSSSLPLASFRADAPNPELYCLLSLISQKLSPVTAQRDWG